MAGQLTIDTLKASANVFATQNAMTGIPKAWVLFNGSSGAITNSFNVGSITKNGTGDWSINFSTNMPNANYSAVASTNTPANGYGVVTVVFASGYMTNQTPTVSSYRVCVYRDASGTNEDTTAISSIVFSS